MGQGQGHHARGLQGGVSAVRGRRVERAAGARRARRTGAAQDRLDARRRDVEIGEPLFLARHDAHRGGSRGIDPARHRGTEKAIPPENDRGQLDRHHESHRAAGGLRSGARSHQGGPRRRSLPRLGSEDLHHLRRARPGGEHRAPGARARRGRARGRARHLAVPRAEVPGERRRLAGPEERGAVRLDRAQARHPREPDCRPRIRKRGRLPGRRGESRPGIHVHHDESRAIRGGHGRPRDRRARLPAGACVRQRARPEPRRRGRRQGGDHHPPPRRAPHADEHEVADRGDARAGLRGRGRGGQVAEAPGQGRARAQPGFRRPHDPDREGLVHRDRHRGGVHGHPGARRHGLHRGDRRGPAPARREDHDDLRRHDRHPGERPHRPQDRARRRRDREAGDHGDARGRG